MQISVSDAEDRLDELIDRAEAGEEVVLIVDGRPVGRLVPMPLPPLDDIWSLARAGSGNPLFGDDDGSG
jgi:prevent-host-death family protein